MKKLLKSFSALICACLVTVCLVCTFVNNNNTISTPIRDVELKEVDIDYESEFSKYEDAKLEYSKEKGYVSFSGIISYSSEELSDIDLVSITNDKQEKLSLEYSFDYEIDENLFYMNVEAVNSEDSVIIDRIEGIPFENENGDIDIVFEVEGDYILLSELTEQELFENWGWFSKVLKKVAVAAAVVTVAAVVVAACAYAAPAVIAVASGSVVTATTGTTVFMAGAVATSTLATCAAFASACATTALVAGSIAATACVAIAANDILTNYNKTLKASQTWTLSELQEVLTESINVTDNNAKKTVVYLGKDPKYSRIANSDRINNVVTFHLDDWMFYENKHGKEGMWILNYAFLNYVVIKEKNENWQIRLTTNYNNYLSIRDVSQPGYFYSKELNFLLENGHVFDSNLTYEMAIAFYGVRYA